MTIVTVSWLQLPSDKNWELACNGNDFILICSMYLLHTYTSQIKLVCTILLYCGCCNCFLPGTERVCTIMIIYLFIIYLGFYVAFNTVQVISRWVVGRAEETSTYSSSGFCTVNCRPTAMYYYETLVLLLHSGAMPNIPLPPPLDSEV